MSRYLARLCEHYVQDFDVVFKEITDPIDLFCKQNDKHAQAALLAEMIDFYQESKSGRRGLSDLVAMGLEYVPGDRNSFEWFDVLIHYLAKKIAEDLYQNR